MAVGGGLVWVLLDVEIKSPYFRFISRNFLRQPTLQKMVMGGGLVWDFP